jgi:TolA-binding protein
MHGPHCADSAAATTNPTTNQQESIMAFYRQLFFARRPGKLFALTFVVCAALGWSRLETASAASITLQEPSAQETNLAQTALNAQNASDFPLAASQWEKLLADFPNSSLTGLAQHNLGVSRVQIALASTAAGSGEGPAEFEKAIEALKNSLTSLDKNETEKLARSFLFLGFAQARLGKDIGESAAASQDKAALEESRKWLTTATQTLEQLQTRFPNFADLDQACFFQGEAFATLGRFDKAAESYSKMLTLPNHAFKFDAILALADVYDQLGQYDQAIENYDLFAKEAEAAGGHEMLSEALYRKAETLLKLAVAADERSEPEQAQKSYALAESLFQTAASDAKFENIDRALFQQAYAANRQRQFEKSAGLYSQVAHLPDSPLATRARVYAGRDYLSANQIENAEAELGEAVQTDSPYTAEAAHWLAQCFLRTRRNQEALTLANSWIEKTSSDNPMLVSLKLDRADAAYMIDDQRQQSPALYLEIADNHPDHTLAPTALYNAAFALLETGNFAEAIKLADRFLEKYESSDYLADTLEVKADASLLADAPQEAESVFRRLVREYPASPKAAVWNVRIGLAQYMQKKYQDTIDWLSPLTEHMSDKTQLAESLHWIGMSYFNLGDDRQAISSLDKSFNTDPTWRRADETLLTLSQAQQRAGQTAEAEQTTQILIEKFPKSSSAVAQALYRSGEMAFANNDFDTAYTRYEMLLNDHPKSELVPHAMYGAAWSLLEKKEFEKSISLFDRLISEFPEHDRANQAKVGRGVSRRLSGDAAGAIADLNSFLQTGPQGQAEIDALYELGLAQIDLKKWPDVVQSFETLLQKAPAAKMADRFHYELAWAQQSNNNAAEAIKQFAVIATEFPDSPLAPEANFHVGNAAYDEQNYDTATKAYTRCVNSTASDSLREKAAYKNAWCFYKQKNYDEALKYFQQLVQDFPEGELHADGLLMISDSLYRMEKHELAFEAYRVAKPAIEASKTVEARVRWQALLHGAQSANKAKRYSEALEFVRPIVDSDITDNSLKQDAYLEIGNAYRGMGEDDSALAAWEKASLDTGETGAEARCMMGELLFGQKKFDDAINAFKLVFYGYGGTQSTDEIRPWQALAVFEAAQCSYVQIKDANPQLRAKLIAEANKHFQYLVDNYPQDKLVDEARKRLTALKQLN